MTTKSTGSQAPVSPESPSATYVAMLRNQQEGAQRHSNFFLGLTNLLAVLTVSLWLFLGAYAVFSSSSTVALQVIELLAKGGPTSVAWITCYQFYRGCRAEAERLNQQLQIHIESIHPAAIAGSISDHRLRDNTKARLSLKEGELSLEEREFFNEGFARRKRRRQLRKAS